MADNELKELDDLELGQVVGAGDAGKADQIYDCKGRLLGKWLDDRTRIGYWPCSKCGKPGHKGSLGFHYCDSCNRWWKGGVDYWIGSEGELVAAANTNV